MTTKRTTTKSKPKKPSIPPPPTGWEIASKDDPRLDYLPVGALFSSKRNPKWRPSLLPVGLPVGEATRNNFVYALPISTQPAAEPAQPMIRLRLPSEKPTEEDADAEGDILVFKNNGTVVLMRWHAYFVPQYVAWLPGRLPEGLLPKEPTQEELWRKEFKAIFPEIAGVTEINMWTGFLAAKKGGQRP